MMWATGVQMQLKIKTDHCPGQEPKNAKSCALRKEVVGLLGLLESVEMKVWNLADKAFNTRAP